MTNSLNLAPEAPITLSPYQNLSQHLKQLHLSHILTHWESMEHQAVQEQWSYFSASRILRFPQNRERHVDSYWHYASWNRFNATISG